MLGGSCNSQSMISGLVSFPNLWRSGRAVSVLAESRQCDRGRRPNVDKPTGIFRSLPYVVAANVNVSIVLSLQWMMPASCLF